MSEEHKKTDKKQSHKPGNIEEFVCKILDRINGVLEQMPKAMSHENLELPEPIGSETESVLKEISENEPITKIRKLIVIPGRHGVDKIEEVLNKLMSAREADINNGLRAVFAQVHKAKTSGEPVYQLMAIKSLDTLIKEADDKTKPALITARNLVLSGDATQMDAANFRVRNVFSSRVNSNTRLAYTSLSTQDGEGYMLCPKSVHQIGKALPIEISKCRDNCIDCRVNRDGAISCAYADWLRKSADNHELVEARLERVKHNLNGTTLNKIGQPDPVQGWEGQLDEIRAKYPVKKEISMEHTLESTDKALFGHQGDAIKRIQEMLDSKNEPNTVQEQSLERDHASDEFDDETLEELLESERDPFTEQELDMMIEELLESSRNKE